MICIFCFQYPETATPFCQDNPGHGCTYGFHHDLGDGNQPDTKTKKQPVKKADKQVCIKCSLHVKNPASQTNGCSHQYP